MQKRNILHLLIGGFILLITSCDVLDVDPLTQIDAENAISDKKGLEAALMGVYDGLQSASIAQDVVVIGDLAADNLIHVGTKKEYRQISDNRIVPSNTYISGIWDNSYEGINNCNIILEKLPDVTGITDEERNSYEAQVRFIRAFNYFNLIRLFGGVPIKEIPTRGISAEELNIPRNSEAEVYTFLLEDLELAETLLQGTGRQSSVFVDEGAVKAFLARVYLYLEQWEDAYSQAFDVIDMGYQLVDGDNFATLYDENASNEEVIWQIDFKNDDDVTEIADWMLPDSRFEVAAWNTIEKSGSIYQAYNAADKRRDVTVASTDLLGGLDYYCKKYEDSNTDSDNMIIFRLAEMYLICAEALNNMAYQSEGIAFDYLNTIRTRAGLQEVDAVDLPDKNAFAIAIEEERRLELAFEGHRYYDLVRTGRAGDVLPDIGPLTQENNYLFPIPQTERDTNKEIAQNEGY